MTELSPELARLRDRLAELTAIPAVAGYEERMIAAFADRLRRPVDEVAVQPRGNVLGLKRGASGGPRVLLECHLDEIGLVVTHIEPTGFLRFGKVGGAVNKTLPGHRVQVHGRQGAVEGVIGLKPGHIMSAEEQARIPPVNEMYVDVGADSADEASAMGISIGCPITFDGPLQAVGNRHRLMGKAVDNRAGCLVLLEVAEALGHEKLAASIYYAGCVEEEIGWRGAASLELPERPDLVVAVDTQPADGTPELKPGDLPYRIGAGACIKLSESGGFVAHPGVVRLLVEAAEAAGVPYQRGALGAGISDAYVLQQLCGGLPAGCIGIPRRYSHSSAELLDLRDLKACIDLLAAFLRQLRGPLDLSRR